jgi:nickel transport protein
MNLRNDIPIKILFTAVIFQLVFIAAPEMCLAHKVSVFAWVESDTVYTLSKFSGGKKVKKGRIGVYDPEGKKLLDGLTDDQGEFAFKVPQTTALRVELTAGAGHKGHWLVPLEEIVGTPEPNSGRKAEKASPGKPAEKDRITGSDDARLQAAIEKALDKKLKPVMKLLAESKQAGPSLTEILGGIGYIIGLVGIAAYFKSRQKK